MELAVYHTSAYYPSAVVRIGLIQHYLVSTTSFMSTQPSARLKQRRSGDWSWDLEFGLNAVRSPTGLGMVYTVQHKLLATLLPQPGKGGRRQKTSDFPSSSQVC